MNAQKEIGLAVVGDGVALVGCDGAVVVARQHDAHAKPRFDETLQSPGDLERDLLLERSLRTSNAGVVAAMPRVDDHGAKPCRLARERSLRWSSRRRRRRR